MTLTHEQAQDFLEGYALWSLPAAERDAVGRHVSECEGCREELRALSDVVAAIPESIVDRSPSAKLRDRILSAARADVAPPRRLIAPPRPAWALSFALFVIAVLSGGVAVYSQLELARVQAESDRLSAIALDVSGGARWWYMSGVDAFAGSEGTLIDPKSGSGAYVLFHELKPVSGNDRYAVWLIRPNGSWVRAANFRPTGEVVQRVAVPLSVGEFVQCAVTVETRDSGAPQGALAMQSRVFSQ